MAIQNYTIWYLTMDLQQTTPLPKLSTSEAFYLRQNWFYNFGIHTFTFNGHQLIMFIWKKDISGKGKDKTVR